MKAKIVLFGFLAIVSAFALGTLFILKSTSTCEKVLILDDESKVTCEKVQSLHGMTFVRTCDGGELQIPTWRIKEIRKIE